MAIPNSSKIYPRSEDKQTVLYAGGFATRKNIADNKRYSIRQY